MPVALGAGVDPAMAGVQHHDHRPRASRAGAAADRPRSGAAHSGRFGPRGLGGKGLAASVGVKPQPDHRAVRRRSPSRPRPPACGPASSTTSRDQPGRNTPARSRHHRRRGSGKASIPVQSTSRMSSTSRGGLIQQPHPPGHRLADSASAAPAPCPRRVIDDAAGSSRASADSSCAAAATAGASDRQAAPAAASMQRVSRHTALAHRQCTCCPLSAARCASQTGRSRRSCLDLAHPAGPYGCRAAAWVATGPPPVAEPDEGACPCAVLPPWPSCPALSSALACRHRPCRSAPTRHDDRAERDAFRAEVRAYLLENPEVLVEAMDVLQRAQAETASAERTRCWSQTNAADDLHQTRHDWVGGNPEGDITLVEFMDYRCGYCRKAYDEVAELVKIGRQHPLCGQGIPDPGRSLAALVAVRHRGAAAAWRRRLQGRPMTR